MRNKGFTLIELLAVIVILAIIALIATPIILGIIKDTKKEADKRNVEMYYKALENALAQQQLDGSTPITGTFETKNGKDILLDEKTIFTVEYDGPEITIDRIDIYEDGSVYIQGVKSKSGGKTLANSVGTKQRYVDGEEVYIDVTTGKSCTNYHVDNSKTGYNGLTTTKTTDNQNSCLKFYSFLDYGGKTLNLLLDHNTTANIEWITQSDFVENSGKVTENLTNDHGVCQYGKICVGNNVGPITALKQLYVDTNSWKGTKTPLNYELDQKNKPSESNYIIDYSRYKARLITAQEIAKITGADKELNWNEILECGAGYYLDGQKGTDPKWETQVANSTINSDYYWLFDRTSDCTGYGCKISDSATKGYWTSTSHAQYSSYAWMVHQFGAMNNIGGHFDFYVSYKSGFGIRPVIEVSKSNL